MRTIGDVAQFVTNKNAGPFLLMIAVADNADLAEIYGIDKQAAFRLATVIAAKRVQGPRSSGTCESPA